MILEADLPSPRYVSTAKLPEPQEEFESALKEIFAEDPAGLNNLLVQMPLFLWALRDGTWDIIQGLIIQAKMATLITQNQYDDIRAASITTRTPLNLPEEV